VSATLPVRLQPEFHEKIWGSTDLLPWFPPSQAKIGEVWFPPPPGIPILVKFLFTSARLSVQVHPPDDYARRHENSAGKTELWHILRAAPGASIALGFQQPITRARLRESAASGEIENLLQWIPVHAGDTYFTPAGTVHAIGEGLALCEIQQPSDVTYRLYDYGRPRELHLDKAVEVADLGTHPGATRPETLDEGHELLAFCPYFMTESLRIHRGLRYQYYLPHLLILLEGQGAFAGQSCRAGEVWSVEADAAFQLEPEPSLRLLRASIPGGR
jgi:mannose-6-phosphate isomerase